MEVGSVLIVGTALVPGVNYDPVTGRTFKPAGYDTAAATELAARIANAIHRENITLEDINKAAPLP